jgi:GAF domain-containing protein
MGILRRGRRNDIDVASCLSNLDRLAALDRSGLMDAPPSDHLDQLTRRAADQLGTPMAVISLLDEHRLFVASGVGLAGQVAEQREAPADASYCQYVVALDDELVINDSTEDELVRDHPATADGVRAYLGAPLRYDDHCLGAFCVVDDRPREWTPEDIATVRALAESAMQPVG